MDIFFYWLAVINLSSAVICIFDKLQAKRGSMRVPEKTLFAFSIAGGSIGMYATMYLIRPTTKHKRFMIGLPIIILLQSVILLCLLHIAA
ncbi:MAG: DUF1294 domain-containing protein [Clostridia bacterium]|nr:DUF1294 domain-containing protein [Clostridia bacterium]